MKKELTTYDEQREKYIIDNLPSWRKKYEDAEQGKTLWFFLFCMSILPAILGLIVLLKAIWILIFGY